MPAHFKVLISVLALIITAALFYFDTISGGGAERWVALVLGPLMVLSIWIFPEAKQKTMKNIRQESAQKHQP